MWGPGVAFYSHRQRTNQRGASTAPRGPEDTPPPDKVEPDPPSKNSLMAQVGSRVCDSCQSDMTTATLAQPGLDHSLI